MSFLTFQNQLVVLEKQIVLFTSVLRENKWSLCLRCPEQSEERVLRIATERIDLRKYLSAQLGQVSELHS